MPGFGRGDPIQRQSVGFPELARVRLRVDADLRLARLGDVAPNILVPVLVFPKVLRLAPGHRAILAHALNGLS